MELVSLYIRICAALTFSVTTNNKIFLFEITSTLLLHGNETCVLYKITVDTDPADGKMRVNKNKLILRY